MEQLKLNIPLKLNLSSELGTSRGATIGVPQKVIKRERPDMSGPLSLMLVVLFCVVIWAYWGHRRSKGRPKEKIRDRRSRGKRRGVRHNFLPY